MAWSIVGVGTLATVASGNVSPAEPAGAADGDLLVACIAYRSNVAFGMPSGWTQIEVQNTGDTDATNGIASAVMAYQVRSGAPSTTFTRTGGDVALARIIAYRGNASSPLGVHSSNTLSVASGTNTTGTLTTGAANSLIVAMSSAGDNLSHTAFDAATDPATASASTPDTTTAPTAGTWIERADTGTATGADGGLAVADAVRATAGSTDTIQCTVSASAQHAMIAAEFLLLAFDRTATLSATLGAATSSATGAVALKATLANTLGAVTLAGTGAVALKAQTAATLGTVTPSATGKLDLRALFDKALGAMTAAATGTVGSITGTLSKMLGGIGAAATGSIAITGTVGALLGGVALSAVGGAIAALGGPRLGWLPRRWQRQANDAHAPLLGRCTGF